MINTLQERLAKLKIETDALVDKLLTEHGSDIFNPAFNYNADQTGVINIPLGRFTLQFDSEDTIESCRGELISEMHSEILKIIELPPAKK